MNREFCVPAFAELPDVLVEERVEPAAAALLSLVIETVTRSHGVSATAEALRRAANWMEDA